MLKNFLNYTGCLIFVLLYGCSNDEFLLLDHVPQEGLVALYSFDGDALDLTTNRFHGTISGSEFGLDRFDEPNQAILFDGVDDYVDISEGQAFKIEPPLSISYWIKLDQNTITTTIFTSSFDSDRNRGVFATFNSNGANPSFSIGDGGVFGSGSRFTVHANQTLEPDRWYHIVGVYSALNEIDVYVDGDLVETFSSGSASSLEYGSGPVTFGRRYATTGADPLFFSGALDEFAFYDRALSSEEVRLLLEAGEAR